MKIRSDFVSNSSSASFILSSQNGSVVLMTQKVAELFNGSRLFTDYGFSSSIRISIKCKNKWFKEIQDYVEFIDGDSVYEGKRSEYKDYYEDWKTGKKVKKDPEEIGWDSIPISLAGLSWLNNNPQLVKKIDHMYFTTEDENSDAQNVWLKLLYDFFEALDCSPDKTGSERSFEESDPVVMKMREIISRRNLKRKAK